MNDLNDLLPTLFTGAAAGIAIWGIYSSRRDSLTTMQATMLKDFVTEFDRLMPIRYVVAQHALSRISGANKSPSELEDIPAELWRMMDFFDKIAMYVKRGYVDEAMTFISFFYWMLPYWEFFGDDVMRMKTFAPLAMWDEIPRQLTRLEEVGRELDVTREGIEESKTLTKIAEFFDIEVKECRPALELGARQESCPA
jgi:hypothetical protein